MGHHVAKISILRNPEDQILSSWDFFRHIGELVPFENAIAKKTNRRMKNQDLFVEFMNNFKEYKDLSPMFSRRFVNPQARKKSVNPGAPVCCIFLTKDSQQLFTQNSCFQNVSKNIARALIKFKSSLKFHN